MIIFLIRNKLSNETFVGSTRNNLEYQWSKILCATEKKLDYPLYNSIRKYGKDAFDIEELDYADTREEQILLEREAINLFNAKSLRGYKTSNLDIKASKKKHCPDTKKSNCKQKSREVTDELVIKNKPVVDISDIFDEEISYSDDDQLLEEDLKYIDRVLHEPNKCNKKVDSLDYARLKTKASQQDNLNQKKGSVKYSNSNIANISSENIKDNFVDNKHIDGSFLAKVKQALQKHKDKYLNIKNQEQKARGC